VATVKAATEVADDDLILDIGPQTAAALAAQLKLAGASWQTPPFEKGGGQAMLDASSKAGLEGVMAKRRSSTYQPGRRSPDWVKAAHRSTRVATVVGWLPEGAADAGRGAVGNARLGAVLLAAPDAEGSWCYLGRAGSGLGGRRGVDLARELIGLDRPGSPLDEPVPAADARHVTWCEPVVTVDVAYLQRTASGRLRQPTIRALRTDVPVDPWETP